jgi:hypothetical protein
MSKRRRLLVKSREKSRPYWQRRIIAVRLATVWIEKRIVRHFRPGSRKRTGRAKVYHIYIGHIIGQNTLVYRAKRG